MYKYLTTYLFILVLSFSIFAQEEQFQDGSLEFNATQGHHVNHGIFWKPGVNYGVFFWEAWVKPYNNAEYVISDGYGGAHALLFGFSGGVNTVALAGNLWDNSANSSVSFGTDQRVPTNQWCHIAVGWDGTKIVTYINGLPSGIVAYNGQRSTPPNSGSGVLFIGGSDHSNFNGKIARVRGFEGVLPMETLLASFQPEMYFRSSYLKQNGDIVTASFLADYSQKSRVYPDLSLGFNGVNHVGILSNGTDSGGFGEIIQNQNSLPQWTSEPVTITNSNNLPPVEIPSGAVVFDSFSRENSFPGLRPYSGLGKLEKAAPRFTRSQFWQGTNVTNWGIMYGRAANFSNTGFPVWVETDISNMDVRVTRTYGAFSLGTVGVVYRYENDNNYGFVYNSNGAVYLVEKVNGTFAHTATGTEIPIWDQMQVVANGNSVKVYLNGIERISTTTGNLLNATKAGLIGLAGTMERFEDFAVFRPSNPGANKMQFKNSTNGGKD